MGKGRRKEKEVGKTAKKILSLLPYESDGVSIRMGKTTYGIRAFRIQAFLIRYLSLVLVVFGIMHILAGQPLEGTLSCIAAVLAFLMGWICRAAAQDACAKGKGRP